MKKNELLTGCDRFKDLKHSSTLPYAFTEQDVATLSTALRSHTAIFALRKRMQGKKLTQSRRLHRSFAKKKDASRKFCK